MADSWSAGNTALPDSKEKTTAQSAPNSGGTLAHADERLRPGDAHATEAAKDSIRHTIAAENETPQRRSRKIWGFGSNNNKKK